MYFLKVSLFILALTQCITGDASTSGSGTSLSSSRAILDSIDADLENIKQNLNRTITSSREKWDAINRKYAPDSNVNVLATEPTGPIYIRTGEEEKDVPFTVCSKPTDGDNIYHYSIPLLNTTKGVLNFSTLKGVTILVVNVATFCESTIEYPQFNRLKEKYGDKLAIVGFPSNNFANQEPTDDPEEIYNAIKYVRPGKGFVPAFPLTKRIDVNGEKAHPIYSFLKRSCPSTRNRFTKNEQYLLYHPRNARDIRWNFEKFLIHPVTGEAWKRYDQKTLPETFVSDIEAMISVADEHKQKKAE